MSETIQLDAGMVFIAALVQMGLGILWYSPSVFGKRWAKEAGITSRTKVKNNELAFTVMFFASLVAAFALEVILESMPYSTAASGIVLGFWAGIGFVATSGLSDHLFGTHKSLEMYFINTGFYTISFMVMGFLLGI